MHDPAAIQDEIIDSFGLFSEWLDFADYPIEMPWALGVFGVLLFLVAIWLLHRSHADLGKNWSPRGDATAGHSLVTGGVYERIRHPMYAAHVVWGIAQALLLREAMAAMGGSEMAWGTMMALWLFGMGLGSRIGAATGSERLARILPVVVLAIAGLGIVLFRAAPALVGAAAGETLTTASAIWLWIAAVTPTAFAGGLAFPILAGGLGASGGGKAYAIEATGVPVEHGRFGAHMVVDLVNDGPVTIVLDVTDGRVS